MLAALQLIVDILIAYDRSGDELWKQRHVSAEADGIVLCVCVAAIDVYYMRKCLTTVSCYSYRQAAHQRLT